MMVQRLRDCLANIARTAARSEAARLKNTIVVIVEAAGLRISPQYMHGSNLLN